MSQGRQPTSTGLVATFTNPNQKFDTVTMDFITGLPERNGKNALMVCCDKLGKLTHLVPTWVGENHLSAKWQVAT